MAELLLGAQAALPLLCVCVCVCVCVCGEEYAGLRFKPQLPAAAAACAFIAGQRALTQALSPNSDNAGSMGLHCNGKR